MKAGLSNMPTTTQKLALGILPVLIGGLVIMEALDLDPDMVKLKSTEGVQSGFIKSLVGGMLIQPDTHQKPFKAKPLLALPRNGNPALEFEFLAKALDLKIKICYRLAESEKPDDPAFIYDIHPCPIHIKSQPSDSENTGRLYMNVSPGKSGYVSSILSAGVVSLSGYEDGIEGAGGGKSRRVERMYLLLADDQNTMRFRRSNEFGYPNGNYKPDDIGRRFCASIHEVLTVKFDDDLQPIGYWKRSLNGVYLWSCKAERLNSLTSYSQLFN